MIDEAISRLNGIGNICNTAIWYGERVDPYSLQAEVSELIRLLHRAKAKYDNQPLKPGDRVKMVSCLEAEKNPDKTWIVRSEPFDICGTECVKLEGKAGGFATKFLKKETPYDPPYLLEKARKALIGAFREVPSQESMEYAEHVLTEIDKSLSPTP